MKQKPCARPVQTRYETGFYQIISCHTDDDAAAELTLGLAFTVNAAANQTRLRSPPFSSFRPATPNPHSIFSIHFARSLCPSIFIHLSIYVDPSLFLHTILVLRLTCDSFPSSRIPLFPTVRPFNPTFRRRPSLRYHDLSASWALVWKEARTTRRQLHSWQAWRHLHARNL